MFFWNLMCYNIFRIPYTHPAAEHLAVHPPEESENTKKETAQDEKKKENLSVHDHNFNAHLHWASDPSLLFRMRR